MVLWRGIILLMQELDHKEGWVQKNWCFQTIVLANTLQSALDSKEIKPVNPKGNQPWIFIGLNIYWKGWKLKLKLQYFGHLIWRADSLENTLMLWKTEGRRGQKDEMVGWHHQFNGHEFEQTLRDSEGQRSLSCSTSWGHRESETTWQLNNNNQCRGSLNCLTHNSQRICLWLSGLWYLIYECMS